jgi:hypothetical protein
MTTRSITYRSILGFRKYPVKTLVNVFIVYASIWTILEPLLGIVPLAQNYFSGELKFFTLVFISILIGLYRSALPEEIEIKYGNSTIKVIYGDLFSFDGYKAIPISRYLFETQVVATSLQNKIIQMFVKSEEGTKGFDRYKQSLCTAVRGEKFQEVYRDATQQQEKYYPLGTTAFIDLAGKDYVLFSLTETELKGYITNDNCNVSKMWIALEIFWNQVRIHARGNSINIPLIGSGVTGIRLAPTQVLEINLLAIANAIEEKGKITTEEIRIILHPKYLEDINLTDLRKIWG